MVAQSRLAHQEPAEQDHEQQHKNRGRDAKQLAAADEVERIAEVIDWGALRDQKSDACENRHGRHGNDERRNLQLGDCQAVDQAADQTGQKADHDRHDQREVARVCRRCHQDGNEADD